MPNMQQPRAMAAVVPAARKTGGHPLAHWRQDVAPTVIDMASKMGPDELTVRAVAQCMGLQDPQVWRVLPKGRADILFLVAADLQMRQTKAVARHDGLRKRTCLTSGSDYNVIAGGARDRGAALRINPNSAAWHAVLQGAPSNTAFSGKSLGTGYCHRGGGRTAKTGPGQR
jgi:hypothetical protein